MIVGTQYQITDRLNIFLTAVEDDVLSYEGQMLIPSGTGSLLADEYAQVYYDLFNDNIFFLKDIRGNRFDAINAPFSTFLTTLSNMDYGNVSISNNVF